MLDRLKVRAITLDLDDTLWPIWPTIARAERALQDWLRARAGALSRHRAALLRIPFFSPVKNERGLDQEPHHARRIFVEAAHVEVRRRAE